MKTGKIERSWILKREEEAEGGSGGLTVRSKWMADVTM